MKDFVLFTLVISLFSSCVDKIDLRKFEVNNSSKENIYTIIYDSDIERDTTNFGGFRDSIYSNSIKEIDRPVDWNTYLNQSTGSKLRLYIIEKDSVQKYGWEAIYTKNIYNQKYTLDIKDLDSLNWIIEYNGE